MLDPMTIVPHLRIGHDAHTGEPLGVDVRPTAVVHGLECDAVLVAALCAAARQGQRCALIDPTGTLAEPALAILAALVPDAVRNVRLVDLGDVSWPVSIDPLRRADQASMAHARELLHALGLDPQSTIANDVDAALAIAVCANRKIEMAEARVGVLDLPTLLTDPHLRSSVLRAADSYPEQVARVAAFGALDAEVQQERLQPLHDLLAPLIADGVCAHLLAAGPALDARRLVPDGGVTVVTTGCAGQRDDLRMLMQHLVTAQLACDTELVLLFDDDPIPSVGGRLVADADLRQAVDEIGATLWTRGDFAPQKLQDGQVLIRVQEEDRLCLLPPMVDAPEQADAREKIRSRSRTALARPARAIRVSPALTSTLAALRRAASD